MTDAPSRDEYEKNVKVAEACGADGPGARTLARGGENAGLLVSDTVKACYDAGGPGDTRSRFERISDAIKGMLSSAFDRAAQAMESTGVPQLADALDRANTSDSEQNRRWENQMKQAGINGPGP